MMVVYTTPFDVKKGYTFLFTRRVDVLLTNLRINFTFLDRIGSTYISSEASGEFVAAEALI